MKSSIRGRLFVFLGSSLVLIWSLVVVATTWVVRHETEEIFDSGLQETAGRLLILAEYQLQAGRGDPAAELPGVAEHPEYLIYQVLDRQGAVLLRSRTAPERALPVALRPGFQSLDGRAFYVDASRDGRYFILVAEPRGHRGEAFGSVLAYMLVPLGAFLPIAALAIHLAIRRAQRPIQALDEEISRRGGNNLLPLAVDQLPRELAGVGKAVNSLLERLRLVLEAERNFTTHSAHELRTPLAAAMAQLQVLEEGLPDAAARSRVGSARQMLDRLYQMTVKLLQLARTESGIALNVERFDLDSLVRLLAGDLGPGAAGRLCLQPPSPRPVWVVGDIDAVGIALQNLLENARRYAPAQAPIEIEVRPNAEVMVRNDCDPVPAEKMARLDQRFVRARRETTGFGLGLSIAQTIARQSGGSLQLSSPCLPDGRGFCAVLKLTPAD